jgi:hypothetical protein
MTGLAWVASFTAGRGRPVICAKTNKKGAPPGCGRSTFAVIQILTQRFCFVKLKMQD